MRAVSRGVIPGSKVRGRRESLLGPSASKRTQVTGMPLVGRAFSAPRSIRVRLTWTFDRVTGYGVWLVNGVWIRFGLRYGTLWVAGMELWRVWVYSSHPSRSGCHSLPTFPPCESVSPLHHRHTTPPPLPTTNHPSHCCHFLSCYTRSTSPTIHPSQGIAMMDDNVPSSSLNYPEMVCPWPSDIPVPAACRRMPFQGRCPIAAALVR